MPTNKEILELSYLADKIRNLENEMLLIRDGSLLTKAKNNIIFSADKGIKTLVGASVYLGSPQSIPHLTWTVIQLNTKRYDLGNDFNTTTYRFTTAVSGYYQINCAAYYDSNAVDTAVYRCYVRRNGSFTYPYLGAVISASGNNTTIVPGVAGILYLNAGDYIEFLTYHNSGVAKDISGTDTYMSVFLLSVA